MRFIFITIFFMISCSESVDTEKKVVTIEDFNWEELTSTPDSIKSWHKDDDIYFIDDNTGWAIASWAGEVYKTEDGGMTWKRQFAAPRIEGKQRPYFRSISFLNKNVGYVGLINGVEYGHIVYETRDGGLTWNTVPTIDSSDLKGVCAMSVVNENTIYMVGRYGGDGHIAKSSDQGKTWTTFNVNDQIEMITDVYFWDENNGIILGGKRKGQDLLNNQNGAVQYFSGTVILKTNNGGQSWRSVYTTNRKTEFGWKFSFPSENVGYASIESYRGFWGNTEYSTEYFLKTDDQGETWKEMPLSTQKSDYFGQQGIGFITEKIGWIGSQDDDHGMKYTDDGGITWHNTGKRGAVNRFRFVNKKAYAIGHYIFKMDIQN